MRVLSLAAAIGLMLLATACGGDSGKTFDLSQKDSGTKLQVSPGDEIVISLESNPTTGYSWSEASASQNNGVLQLIAKDYASESDAIGAGGVETWTYKAVKPGKADLELDYLRPFEPDKIVGKFAVTIDVVG